MDSKFEILVQQLRSKKNDVRYQALLSIYSSNNPDYCEYLIPLLEDEDKRVRLLVMKIFVKFKYLKGKRSLLRILKEEKESDPNLFCYLIYSLAVFGEESIFPQIFRLINSSHRQSVYWGVKALASYHKNHLEKLVNLLGHRNWFVKHRVHWELRKMGLEAEEVLVSKVREIQRNYHLRKNTQEKDLLVKEEKDILFWIIKIALHNRFTFINNFKEFIFLIRDYDILKIFSEYLLFFPAFQEDSLPAFFEFLSDTDANLSDLAIDFFKDTVKKSLTFLLEKIERQNWIVKRKIAEVFSEWIEVDTSNYLNYLYHAKGDRLFWLLYAYFLLKRPLCNQDIYKVYEINSLDNRDLRNIFYKIIIKFPDKVFFPIALEILKSDFVYQEEIFNLLKRYWFYQIDSIISLLSHRRWKIRKIVADFLMKTGNKILPQLINFLKSEDENIVFWSLKIIENLGDAALKKLLDIYYQLESVELRAKIIEIIGKKKYRPGEELVVEGLYDENWSIRASSILAIGDLEIKGYEEKIKFYLYDEDENLRGSAALTLGKLRYEPVIDDLIKLLDDVYYEVRVRAVKGLAYFRKQNLIDLFFQKLKEEEISVKKALVEALAQFEDDKIFVKLATQYLDDPFVNKEIISLLGDYKVKDGVKFLEKLVTHDDKLIRTLVLEALMKINTSHAQKVIKSFLQDHDWELRERARNFLHLLEYERENQDRSKFQRDFKRALLFLKKGKNKEAVYLFKKLLEKDKNNFQLLLGLALSYRNSRAYFEAVSILKKALLVAKKETDVIKANLYLADTYYKIGRYGEAKRFLESIGYLPEKFKSFYKELKDKLKRV